MANGELCIHCGYQQASHDFPDDHDGVCGAFDDGIKHRWYCEEVVEDVQIGSFRDNLYCGGNCRAFMRRVVAERRAELAQPLNHAVWMLTPYGVVDIGS